VLAFIALLYVKIGQKNVHFFNI